MTDGFEGFTTEHEGQEDQGQRVLRGQLLKFTNDSEWIIHPDGDEMPEGTELVATGVARVVQRWENGKTVETIVVPDGERIPDVAEMNEAVPKTEWVEGPDGQLR